MIHIKNGTTRRQHYSDPTLPYCASKILLVGYIYGGMLCACIAGSYYRQKHYAVWELGSTERVGGSKDKEWPEVRAPLPWSMALLLL